MSYVDGFVLLVPKKKLAAYKRMATLGAKIWREHGALDYRECVGDDLKVKFGMPFTKLAKPKAGEAIVFSFIVYKSRAHRDKVNAKVMADKRMTGSMTMEMPFDPKRMAYGGFKTFVEV
jgi:uncharacterized protein YbaA (DUF1428 family)